MLDLGAGAALVRRASGRDDLAWWMIDRDPACAAAFREPREIAPGLGLGAGAVAALEDLRLDRARIRFDAVILGDVLEHLAATDATALLGRVRAALAPGGRVMVSVPNVAHLWVRLQLLAGRFEYRERGILDRDHLRFFTGRSLERTLAEARLTARRRAVSIVPREGYPRALPAPLRPAADRAQAALARIWPAGFGYQWLIEAGT